MARPVQKFTKWWMIKYKFSILQCSTDNLNFSQCRKRKKNTQIFESSHLTKQNFFFKMNFKKWMLCGEVHVRVWARGGVIFSIIICMLGLNCNLRVFALTYYAYIAETIIGLVFREELIYNSDTNHVSVEFPSWKLFISVKATLYYPSSDYVCVYLSTWSLTELGLWNVSRHARNYIKLAVKRQFQCERERVTFCFTWVAVRQIAF